MTGPELYAEGFFVIIPEWVLDAEVSDKAVRLYGVLRSYADHRTGVAFPSRPTLAARLHVSDTKTVDRAMVELEDLGAVEVWRASNVPGEGRTSNRYLLRHTPPQWHQRHTPSGTSATTQNGGNGQTASSPPGGTRATDGTSATPPMAPAPPVAPAPLPQWHQSHYPSGSGAPLTRPRELDPENYTHPLPPAGAGEAAAGQLALVPEEEPRPRSRTRATGDALFDEFWAAYPKKVGKDAARRAWAKAARRADAAKIIDVVCRYPFRSELKYVKDPSRWLNEGCWEDDLDAVTAAKQEARRGRWGGDLGPRTGYGPSGTLSF